MNVTKLGLRQPLILYNLWQKHNVRVVWFAFYAIYSLDVHRFAFYCTCGISSVHKEGSNYVITNSRVVFISQFLCYRISARVLVNGW